MGANNAHGGINSPGWEQMRLNKAREAQIEAEEDLQKPNMKKIWQNRLTQLMMLGISLFFVFCVIFYKVVQKWSKNTLYIKIL